MATNAGEIDADQETTYVPTPPRVDDSIHLSDGRSLAYAEYGEPNGVPVFLFHGLPGSRLSWGNLPGVSFPPGIRAIAPDRPGYGQSDPMPGRTLLHWADDVEELADSLPIAKFGVLGVSGGGPGALACAYKIPERLVTVGVVSSAAPTNAPGVFAGMSRINRFFMRLAWRLPRLSELNIRLLASLIRRNSRGYIETMKRKVHDVDRSILALPNVSDMLAADFAEALRRGPQGMMDDMAANHGRPWGFPLEEIRTKVLLWACELDRSVPPAMAEYLSRMIPNCKATLVPDAGHLWILTHLSDVLRVMVSDDSVATE